MKKSILPLFLGIIIGSATAYGSLIIAGKSINKSLAADAKKEEEKHDLIVSQIKSKFSGICPETTLDKYLSVIDTARKQFENDYGLILKDIDAILNSEDDAKNILIPFETYIVALDIIHDATLINSNNITPDQSSEKTTFFEDTTSI